MLNCYRRRRLKSCYKYSILNIFPSFNFNKVEFHVSPLTFLNICEFPNENLSCKYILCIILFIEILLTDHGYCRIPYKNVRHKTCFTTFIHLLIIQDRIRSSSYQSHCKRWFGNYYDTGQKRIKKFGKDNKRYLCPL